MDKNINIKKRAAILSLIIGCGMFAAKFIAYFVTGSDAIFSDAAESVVHVLATAMALYSIILSSKPADSTHLYGHGNVEFFSAGIEGMLIFIAALFIIYESTMSIIEGQELQKLDLGILIVGSAGVINLALGSYLVSTGKKTNSLTLIADGKHVLTDSYTSLGVLVGISLVLFTGYKILDPLFAIAVAVNIMFTGYKLVRTSIGGLMNETDEAMLNKLINVLLQRKKDYWIDIHEFRYWRSGDSMFVDFHLILPYYFTIQQTHGEEKELTTLFENEIQNVQLKIHFDYCVPELCKYCRYSECNVRQHEFSVNFEWDRLKLTGKPVYSVYQST
ncbi:MAG: cation transporter [Ignavibacteriales bacterium]|nr:MAG: cation transporter [Ignavibacteriales bacterium]